LAALTSFLRNTLSSFTILANVSNALFYGSLWLAFYVAPLLVSEEVELIGLHHRENMLVFVRGELQTGKSSCGKLWKALLQNNPSRIKRRLEVGNGARGLPDP